MSCNCNSGETPEYYITLNGVGADGYSPEINIVQEDTSSFKLNLINKNNEQITPAIPKLEYLNDTFVTNDALNTTLEDYSTTVEMNTALNLKLNKDGSNANNPITINNLSIQSIGTGTRVGSSGGALTLQGSGIRPAYLQTGGTSKSLALLSDVPTVTNKLETDGSNATSNIAINGITFRNQSNYNNIIKAKDGLSLELSNGGSVLDNTRATIYLQTNGSVQLSGDNNVNLSAVNNIHLDTTNGKAYYGSTTDASKELATIGDIKNSTITITQGGVVKGSFNLNQFTDATIALDAGGGSVSGNRIQLITEDGTRGVSLGINNTTKEAFMTYDIIGGISFDLNLISGKTAPITLTKNSDGTYGIGLDYDNDTLKVNQNGQLYADIEAPTYTAGTGIDINNEEISVDSDYIEAHKAYLADGDTLTDPQGLQDVIYYNQSSFDENKFTVVGSPVITDDGIMTLPSTSTLSYVQSDIKISDLTAHSFEITYETKITENSLTQTNRFFGMYPVIQCEYRPTEGSYGELACILRMLNENSQTFNLNLGTFRFSQENAPQVGDVIFIKMGCIYNLKKYYFQIFKNGERIYNNEVINNNTFNTSSTNKIQAGVWYTAVANRDKGEINLRKFSISIDGVPVFSGNKTGIDTIKPDDYTVIGTPTISADGVASGFSSSNYLQTNFTYNTFIANFSYTWNGTNPTASSFIYRVKTTNSYEGISIYQKSNGYLDIVTNVANSSHYDFRNFAISANIPVLISVAKTETSLSVNAFQNGINIYSKTVETNIPTLDNSSIFQIGKDLIYGSIDLNSIKIYVDGNLVYQPCLKIPYTQSKTGSKIVQSVYRDRVNDMAEQFGYANYYTLDKTNGNFTLPMGEIYGYITRLEGIVKDLQTRLTALESNINGSGAGVVQQGLLGMSPLSLSRPQLLGEFNPEDEMNTMDIEPTEEVTQEELEPQPIEEEVPQEEEELEPQETEEEPIEETVEEQEKPQRTEEEGGQDE